MGFPVEWDLAGTGDWNDDVNWADDLMPDGASDESGVISNGGTAQVTDTPPFVGGVVLGETGGSSGTLEITPTGSLEVAAGGQPDTDGIVQVGVGGTGTLLVEGGLTAVGLVSNAASSASFSGSANVNISGATDLSGTTTITGPNVTFQTASLIVRDVSTFVAEITGATHSPIVASDSAFLDGNLQVAFSGFTPTAGMSWDLVSADSLTGGFDSFQITGGGTLGVGQQYTVRTVSDGGQQTARLAFEQVLVLEVDTSDGGISIVNSGGSPVSFDGYRITSGTGVLSPTQWSSLQHQAVSGWEESNASANQLAELNPTASSQVAAAGDTPLGNGYQPNFATIPFGESGQDVAFEYTDPTTGDVVNGQVVYLPGGMTNNLLLTIDPATGEARLSNDSLTNVAIDGYRISSESNSLLTGSWTSFADRPEAAFDGWEEANVSSGQLAELNPDATLPLNTSDAFDIGTVFNTSGEQDVMFEFILAGSDDPMQGAVRFASLEGLVGDYNNDGSVDAADYTVWRDKLGSLAGLVNRHPDNTGPVGPDDYTAWVDNFGASSGNATGVASVAAVPEPGAAMLVLGVAIGCWRIRRRKS